MDRINLQDYGKDFDSSDWVSRTCFVVGCLFWVGIAAIVLLLYLLLH